MNPLGDLFSQKPAPMLGLDISSTSIKLVELGRNSTGQLILQRCAIEPLAQGCVVAGTIEKFEEVAQALRRLLDKSGAKTKRVAMALPTSAVITKSILVSAELSEQELEFQVETEAGQYIPFPMDEVSLDFCVVGPSPTSSGDLDVLIAASRKERVQDLQGLAEAAGLKPAIVDIEAYASRLATQRLIEMLPDQGVGVVVALFELGALTSSLQVICDEEVLYERDLAFGGHQLTEMIMHQYGFSAEEAETKKCNADLPDDYNDRVRIPFMDLLAQEAGRALKFFFTTTAHQSVDYVMLAGGTAALAGLAEVVTEQTNFPCRVLNPFEGMEIAGGVPLKWMAREAPSYLTSCGLALRRFQP
ncbi:MAG: pilus assembly protein PilM [Burkholderiaceae bacterium]